MDGFLLKNIRQEMVQAWKLARQSPDGVAVSCEGVPLDVQVRI